jgi:protoporphyrinogen oxidase
MKRIAIIGGGIAGLTPDSILEKSRGGGEERIRCRCSH